MNINFTIKVHNFDKAASIENSLKSMGITYCVRVDDKPSLGSSRKIRQIVGKDELLAVTTCISDHPDWTMNDVARSTGVGKSSVGRIKLGTHALQRKSNSHSDIAEDI